MNIHLSKHIVLHTLLNILALVVLLGTFFGTTFDNIEKVLTNLRLSFLLLFLVQLPFLLSRPPKTSTEPLPHERWYVGISRVFIVCAWIWIIGPNVSRQQARKNFERWAGFPPPSSVSHIYYKEYHGWVGKDSAVWIKFTCSDEKVLRELLRKHLIDSDGRERASNPFAAPSWWDLGDTRWDNGEIEALSHIKVYYGRRQRLYYDTQRYVGYYEAFYYWVPKGVKPFDSGETFGQSNHSDAEESTIQRVSTGWRSWAYTYTG